MDLPPSIFNDVIGPVMRGPSSSHCAAAVRIGRMAHDLMAGRIERLLLEFDAAGSLAHTHTEQGSDTGLFAGLLGWDADDERLPQAGEELARRGVAVEIRVGPYGDPHPNTYRLTLEGGGERRAMIALSTGGGMVEVTSIDGISLSLRGDRHVTLLAADRRFPPADLPAGFPPGAEVLAHGGEPTVLIELRTPAPLPAEFLRELARLPGVRWVRPIRPVLPVLTRPDIRVPFLSCAEMLAWNRGRDLDLTALAAAYESARGGIPEEEVFRRMQRVAGILARSIEQGLSGTDFPDRILPAQAPAFRAALSRGGLIDSGVLNRMVLYAAALMEVKSAFGTIVAAPTAGSCGAVPAAVFGLVDTLALGAPGAASGLLAAGMIGVFVAAHATFAAELGGCLAECGAASAMAAAALVALSRGSAPQAAAAASMALQNVLGLVCDPVANRVEVPCLGRNVLAVANALSCANLALAGFDPVIPLDETIAAMADVGRRLPPELRCTGGGGLSLTPTARAIARRLAARRKD
ncbi:MAG: L-serine ammonia-lyase, iron-sulfur-dependent, subunit alpha [Desulfobacterales bacterium]